MTFETLAFKSRFVAAKVGKAARNKIAADTYNFGLDSRSGFRSQSLCSTWQCQQPGMITMIEALDSTLTDCRDRSSFNKRPAIPIPLDPLYYAVNPPRSAAIAGINLHRHINPPPRPIGTLRSEEIQCELLMFAKGKATEMEFSLSSHLVILLPDGMSSGCEWSTGESTGKSSSMPPNTIIFSPADDYLWLRKRTSHASSRLLLLTISPKVMNRLSASNSDTSSVRFVQRIGMDDENVRGTMLTFLQEIQSPGWNSNSYVETLLTLLLSQLIRCASNLAGPQRLLYRKGGLPSWRLKRALELLESDLCEAPSLTELARHLQLHPTSFCRAFKQSTGLTPHRYLLSHRINCAKEMMKDHTRSMTEIALDCGFSSSSQFSLVFRRIVGTSPREYRRGLL
jgi:AraC family transcriptional regulator